MTSRLEKQINKKAKSLYSTFYKFGIKFKIADLREWIIDIDMCPYCNKKLKPKDLSVDHIIPKSRGGSDDIRNLRLVCKKCNLLKGNFIESEFSRVRHFIEDNPDIAIELSRRLRSSGFLYRR